MSFIQRPVTERRYPLRFWLMAIYATGFPNFVKFDETGLTHKTSLLNVTSLEGILIVLVSGFVLCVMWLLNRQPVVVRRFDYDAWLWIALAVDVLLATLLMPTNKLNPHSHNDILISLFRYSAWIVAFVLLLSLYAREPKESATDLIIRLIGISSWFNVIMIWLILPVMPAMAFGVDAENPESARRLGGIIISPIGLGVMAVISFFYALLFFQGSRKWMGCTLAFVTLAATYARSQQLSFVVLLFAYLLFISRKPVHRWLALLMMMVGVAGAAVFSGQIMAYGARGNGVNNILTLSERTYVWRASWQAFVLRPFIGYGMSKGVQNAIRDQWTFAHWVPPEAHNELLQALLTGGIVAFLLVLALFVVILWKAFRSFRYGPKQMFLLIVLLQMTIMSIGESMLTVGFNREAALFLLAFLGIAGNYRTVRAGLRARAAGRNANVRPRRQMAAA